MLGFPVTFQFWDITRCPLPPNSKDLLFYHAPTGNLARGWVGQNGSIVLIGGKWEPTHWAEQTLTLQQATHGITRPVAPLDAHWD